MYYQEKNIENKNKNDTCKLCNYIYIYPIKYYNLLMTITLMSFVCCELMIKSVGELHGTHFFIWDISMSSVLCTIHV